MLSVKRRTYAVAAASIFSVVYAILGLFPVSAYIGVGSFLTFRETLSPLAGMLFGPVVGGFSMILGNFLDFALGKPVVFDFLDFVPDLVSAVVAGLAFTGRRKLALLLPVVLVLWYSLDPLSTDTVVVAGVPVPFLWMHIASLVALAAALVLETKGRLVKVGPWFIGAVAFAATMSAHVAGSVLYENVIFRLDSVVPSQGFQGFWTAVFYVYPFERTLFAVLGTAVSYSVLRALLRWKRG